MAERSSLNKPRLLIILNRFVIGGQAVDTIPLASHLISDFEILVLFGEKEEDEIEPSFLLEQYPGVQLKKIKHLRRSINPFIDILAFLNLLIVLFKFKPHIVHTHGAKSGFIGRLTAWIARVPVIIHTFHGHFFHSYFSKKATAFIILVERIMGKITTCAVALSEAQKNELVYQFKILPASKIKIISLGFAFKEGQDHPELRQRFRNNYNVNENEVAVGIVGRIVAIKNHSFFINVAEKLLQKPPATPVVFFIIGDGDLKNNIQSELKQKKIPFSSTNRFADAKVIFTSWLTKMQEVMNGLDIIVLTSLNEGTPLSIIEAQFFKRPVISTNVGGVKDTLVNGKTGFLSESNDVATFTENLRLLIENNNLRTQMGKEGYKYVSHQFSKQKEIEATKQLYMELLKSKQCFLES